MREGYIPVSGAQLFFREVGDGPPIVLLHGGPDFDHCYVVPEMDRLADGYRLIYYDQRGRGASARDVVPDDVSIDSEVDDLDQLRKYLGLESIGALGRSWAACWQRRTPCAIRSVYRS